MAASAAAFEKAIRLNVAKYTDPARVKAFHIAYARRGLQQFLGRQQAKPGYTIETDGSPSGTEESVKPYGLIVYRFARVRQIAAFALAEAIRISPRGTKPKRRNRRYADSWFILADGAEVGAEAIPFDAKEVLITNDQPYSRKINVGAKGFEKYVPPGLVEKVRQATIRRFSLRGGFYAVEVDYITLQGGHALRRQGVRVRKNGTRYARPDMKVGTAITYPAVAIRRRF